MVRNIELYVQIYIYLYAGMEKGMARIWPGYGWTETNIIGWQVLQDGNNIRILLELEQLTWPVTGPRLSPAQKLTHLTAVGPENNPNRVL